MQNNKVWLFVFKKKCNNFGRRWQQWRGQAVRSAPFCDYEGQAPVEIPIQLDADAPVVAAHAASQQQQQEESVHRRRVLSAERHSAATKGDSSSAFAADAAAAAAADAPLCLMLNLSAEGNSELAETAGRAGCQGKNASQAGGASACRQGGVAETGTKSETFCLDWNLASAKGNWNTGSFAVK